MQNREIFLFRVIEGERRRCKFTVDESLTILKEETMEKEVSLADYKRQFGVTTETQKDGSELVTHIPEISQRIMRFFNASYECDFPGCVEMHAEFMTAVSKADCVGCKKGALIRAMSPKVRELILAADASK